MAIRNSHAGKVIILWAWGGLLAGLMLTDFMGRLLVPAQYHISLSS